MPINDAPQAEGDEWVVKEGDELVDRVDATALPPSDPPLSAVRTTLALGVVEAMKRLGVPLLIFGAVLLVLMGVMSVLLSPDRFPVLIGFKSVKMGDLTAEYTALRAEESALSAEREQLRTLVPTPVLRELSSLRTDDPPLAEAFTEIERIRSSFAQPLHDPIAIDSLRYDRSNGTVTIVGSVRDALSIQVLASFVDGLRTSGAFSRVSEPEYRREADDTSPFTLLLTF